MRGQILLAFLAMSLITAGLGGYAVWSIRRAGLLVANIFDHSLMAIDYARAAGADFAGMQAALARRGLAAGPQAEQLDARAASLARAFHEDIAIAAQRAQSDRAVRAAAAAVRDVEDWQAAGRRLLGPDGGERDWRALDAAAHRAEDEIDLLINYTAGDGFIQRGSAIATIAADRNLNVLATTAALALSALTAWLLSRRILRPVIAASAMARRIARGELDGEIPRAGADELGALLAAMTRMRENIRAMMEREVQQRRSAQARLADALEGSGEGVIVADAAGKVMLANSQARAFFSANDERLGPGALFTGIAAALARPAEAESALGAAFDGEQGGREVQLADGRWLRLSRSPTRDGGFVAVCSDVTDLKDSTARLEAANLALDAALGNIAQGVCLFDPDNRLRVVNRRFAEIFRLAPEEVRPGMSCRELLELRIAAGNHIGQDTDYLLAEETGLAAEQDSGLPRAQELSDGRVVTVSRRGMADGGWVATYEDVTERHRAEAQIVYMARHDALTGLPNRALFKERVDQAIAAIGRSHEKFAVLLLDLDRFKSVNDTLGHPAGDALLLAVAERLQSCVRQVDTVARLGGDEFAVVQGGIERAEDAEVLARRFLEVISATYDIDGHRVMVDASIGISIAPDDGATCNKLLKNADVALYRAKADGRATYRFFEPGMDARLHARRELELDLRQALERNEFELFYQPLLDLAEDRISGFEALLRWRHPERGMVSPAEFIPVAEEIGLIVPLGEWVLRSACAEATQWPADVKVAVNVSAAQFTSARLVQSVAQALAESGLAASRLELEITESVLLVNSTGALATLRALRASGIRTSMDDFGTGYSSLSYLSSFPFDKIKIDQSFIRDLTKKDGAEAIVRAILGLGGNLGIRTTAEGVEARHQLEWLRRAGCDEVQGYWISKPCPAGAVPELLESWSGRAARHELAMAETI